MLKWAKSRRLYSYKLVAKTEDANTAESQVYSQAPSIWSTNVPWMISTYIFAFLFLVSFLTQIQSNDLGTFEKGFRSDFGLFPGHLSTKS